jgi:hypothetical protein
MDGWFRATIGSRCCPAAMHATQKQDSGRLFSYTYYEQLYVNSIPNANPFVQAPVILKLQTTHAR